ncbi:MAG: hypothetical protein JOZ62_06570 [Acidobacteriaceae bacterium]|nr:hypothetical protein [Acidobacteriaceae bacterium]
MAFRFLPISVQRFIGSLTFLTLPLFGQVSASHGAVRLGRHTPHEVLENSAKLLRHYDSGQMLRLAIGLRHADTAAEEQFLADLQDRNSPQFHHFLTAEEWNGRFAPSASDEEAVVKWAKAQNLTVTERYANRLIVDIEAPVATVEKALNVSVNMYQLGSNAFFSNDRDPQVPPELAGIVESVGGLNNLHVMHSSLDRFRGSDPSPVYVPGPVHASGKSWSNNASHAATSQQLTANLTNGWYDPTDIWSSNAYNYVALQNLGHCCNPLNNPGGAPPEASIAIATSGRFDPNDLATFVSRYPYLAYHLQAIYVDGTPANIDPETTLDVEWATATSNSQGLGSNTATIYVYEGANASLNIFNDVYNQMLVDGRARVLSTSWGCAEYYCDSIAAASTAHGIFNAMAAQGWTLVAASGDQGATTDCAHVSVTFPASDPNFIAVGGTRLTTSSVSFGGEIAWTGGSAPGSCAHNDGGSGGGTSTFFPAPSYQTGLGYVDRAIPDIALNAMSLQNFYYAGQWYGVGGTSIAAPEMAGFFAQENAYLLYLTSKIGRSSCYASGTGACVPMGNANYFLYYFGQNPGYAPHYPFYDIVSGCNGNDITTSLNLPFFCAAPSYDQVTGWGSANMLQLAWAINTYIAGDGGAPVVSFSGPGTGRWYNSNQTVSWAITDTSINGRPIGVAGYSGGWDAAPAEAVYQPTPGTGNSFYSGPQYPNATSGSLSLAAAGQGCHTAIIEAWDNGGIWSGNQSYGPVCYDTTPPHTVGTLTGPQSGSSYLPPVRVTLIASDSLSGVANIVYRLDGGPVTTYTGPFSVTSAGTTHTIVFHATDNAGNVESDESISFTTGSSVATTPPALQFVPVRPCRIADTRNPSGPFGGPILSGGTSREFIIPASSCGIPASAAAYSLNVTVVPSGTLGYLTIWPAGQGQPLVSTLNSDGRVKANAAIVPAGANGAVSVYASNPTHVVLDVNGYFVPAATNASALAFFPVTPCRLVDTRFGIGPLGGPYLNGGIGRSFPLLSSSCQIPSSAQAYSLNVTAVPHTGLGYLSIWPAGQSQPLVSTLNASTARVTANAAIVPAGTGGDVSLYASNDTDVVIDLNGYFAPSASGGLALYTVPPCRALDTRNPPGSSTFNGTLPVTIANNGCNVPGSAEAYVLNATVVPSGGLGYLSLWPDGQVQPLVSTLNASDSAVTSNMAIVPSTNGSVDAFASNSTHLILDVSSYFAP